MGSGSNAKRPAATRGVPRRSHEVKTFNAHTLEALKKSNQSEVVRRLIATIEQAWSATADRTPTTPLTIEPTQDEKEEAFDGKEKVLITVECNGLVEIYSEKWVMTKVLELKPWMDAEQEKNALGTRYLGPYWESKLAERVCVRPKLTMEEQLEWYVRVSTFEQFKKLAAAGKLPELSK